MKIEAVEVVDVHACGPVWANDLVGTNLSRDCIHLFGTYESLSSYGRKRDKGLYMRRRISIKFMWVSSKLAEIASELQKYNTIY